MRQTKGMRVWSVVYPVLLYFAVCQLVSILQQMLPFTAGLDAVKRQIIDTAAGLVVLYMGFIRREKSGYMRSAGTLGHVMRTPCADGKPEQKGWAVRGRLFCGMLSAAVLVGAAGIALNNLIALTRLRQMSESYQAVEQAFYSSSLLWELLAFCILTPIAEELLYRYLVFYSLWEWLGRWAAIVGSALIFGLMHMNAVQILYACALGLLLGILMEYYRDVRVPMCGHIAANLCAVLRGETGFLRWLKADSGMFLPITWVLLVIVIVFAGLYVKSFKNISDKSENQSNYS